MKIASRLSKGLVLVLLCNLGFTAIYIGASFLPKDKMVSTLQKASSTGVLKTPLNSIERATTGWGIDYGTECVALSIGLRDKEKYEGIKRYFSRFYDGFSNVGAAEGVFDPCSGLNRIVNSSSEHNIDSTLESYARNWWGMSIFMQILYLLLGLALAKSYIFIIGIVLTCYFYHLFSKMNLDYKMGGFLLAPLILFADFQEIHNSYPFMMFYIQMMATGIFILKIFGSKSYSIGKILSLGLVAGSIYNFIFWLDFHMVITFSALVIFLITWGKQKNKEIFKIIFLFESAWIFGFIFSTVYKWIISSVLFGSEVKESIFTALGVRLSSSSGGLNVPLTDYSQSFSFLPVPFRAILINLMAFASKFVDPRNSSILGLVIVLFCFATLLVKFLGIYKPWAYIPKVDGIFIILLSFIPFFYYFITPNHSFNHAVLTYRALPISLGFLLAAGYKGKLINKK
jgi:hypothetical protein